MASRLAALRSRWHSMSSCWSRFWWPIGRPPRRSAHRPPYKEILMLAIVVYESHWGNTEAVARAIADGIGPDARVLTTDEATPAIVGAADLVVAGAPVMAFSLPRAGVEKQLAADVKAPRP